jgi:hypothetical protein
VILLSGSSQGGRSTGADGRAAVTVPIADDTGAVSRMRDDMVSAPAGSVGLGWEGGDGRRRTCGEDEDDDDRGHRSGASGKEGVRPKCFSVLHIGFRG